MRPGHVECASFEKKGFERHLALTGWQDIVESCDTFDERNDPLFRDFFNLFGVVDAKNGVGAEVNKPPTDDNETYQGIAAARWLQDDALVISRILDEIEKDRGPWLKFGVVGTG